MKKSLSDLRELACAGDSEAQLMVGEMYFNGAGVSRNYKEAFRWFKEAADQGDAQAQYEIAHMYENGFVYENTIDEDDKETVKWYKLSSANGYARAQFKLAQAYIYGDTVPKNRKEAFRLLYLAADNGHQEAIDFLDFVNPLGPNTRNWS